MKQKRHRRKAFRQARKPEVVASRFNRNSVLWFGPHKDKRIRETPRPYLVWLAQQPDDWSWRMRGLKLFLRQYLERTQ